MRDLNYQLKQLCDRNRDGSYATQFDRARILSHVANQLHDLGYRHMNADSLRPKHVDALVQQWKADGVSAGTMKNRMSAMRWWAQKIGKDNIIARDNGSYDIDKRTFVTNISKAKVLDDARLAKITDAYTAMSLRLQSEFGLRREESIKIVPTWADGGDRLKLKDAWTKGGKYREIAIRTPEQRTVLNEAKRLAAVGSLIPSGLRYRDQLQRFRAQCDKAGIHGVHGLRHNYAQERYRQLTSWQSPARGGPRSSQLGPEQRQRDLSARLLLSEEMGHGREQITAIYLGR
ncbi:integrase [Rugamonas sp. FT107W]|uniref:Integrase n=1 Tax=Duganella vulcania TaxID=2692166 RepID=A0A845HI82_9BURK|nr:phage integrase N-terminal domain-containing protein [Duganella vulcania]MYN18490.1 integrase [Duganella vulcania]